VTRSKTPQGCESSLLAWLVIWALQEQEAHEARTILQQVHQCLDSPVLDIPEGELSPWLLTAICVQTILMTVQGHWTSARLDLCLPYHFNAFCMAVPENDACSPIRSVLSWTNLLPFPLLDLEVLFANLCRIKFAPMGRGGRVWPASSKAFINLSTGRYTLLASGSCLLVSLLSKASVKST